MTGDGVATARRTIRARQNGDWRRRRSRWLDSPPSLCRLGVSWPGRSTVSITGS